MSTSGGKRWLQFSFGHLGQSTRDLIGKFQNPDVEPLGTMETDFYGR